MNRTLKRPMFRRGGAAEGITSGLDAPRQGYRTPGLVDFFPTQQEFESAREMFPVYERPQGEALSRFLMSTGLDLLSRPPQGGLLSTAALAAKEPTKQLFEDIDTDRATKFATDADLFKTLITAKGEALSGMGDTASRGVKLQIADDIENTMDIIFKLENKKNTTPNEFTEEDQLLLDKKKNRFSNLTRKDEVASSLLTDEKYTQRIMRKIKDNLLELKQEDGVTPRYSDDDDPKLLEDMFFYYNEFFREGKFPEFKATGGRVGYQMGGDVNMGQMPATEEPKIDYSTLRARLPKQISDDVVRLIAASPEALEDFATIATQSDVDMFNQKYSVNLVLPQEA
jgi:hypothetical protein